MSNYLANIKSTATKNWYITIPVLAALLFGGYKLYSKVKNFYNTFDFKVGVARVHSFDISSMKMEIILTLTATNHTGINIDLTNTSIVAKSGGYMIGNTPQLPKIVVLDGETLVREIPFTIDIGNIASNYQSVLESIDIHAKTHIMDDIPINYTYTEDMSVYVDKIPGILDKVNSVFDYFKSRKGVGYVSQTKKVLWDASLYEPLYDTPTGIDHYEHDGEPTDTVDLILRNVKKFKNQTRKVSQVLKGNSVEEACENIWKYYYHHFQYKEDVRGKEQVRSPRRAFADRFEGIDCDCFAQCIMCHLDNLGIKGKLRIVKRGGADNFSHIYVVVPHRGREIIIDPVMDVYNQEPSKITFKLDQAA